MKLECTNGGIKLRLPRDAKATISAQHHQRRHQRRAICRSRPPARHNRRRLEGRLNGGGARIQIEGTNGGITLTGR